MPDIRGLISDPQFRRLSPERKRTILVKTGANPAFVDELLGVTPELEAQREAITAPAVAGARMRSEDPGLAAALAATRETMADPEALGAGYLGSTGPATAAGVAGTVLPFGAGARTLGAAYGAYQGGKRGGPVGALAGGVAGAVRPGATGAVGGAVEGYEAGGVPGAVVGGALGSMVGGRGGGLLKFLSRMRGGGQAAAMAEKAAAKAGPDVLAEYRAATEAAKARYAAIPESMKGIPPAAATPVAAAPAAAARAAAVEAAAPAAAQATVPGSMENLLLQLKDMNSTAAGRKQLLEYLKTQPPEVAAEIRALLGPATRHRPFIGGR